MFVMSYVYRPFSRFSPLAVGTTRLFVAALLTFFLSLSLFSISCISAKAMLERALNSHVPPPEHMRAPLRSLLHVIVANSVSLVSTQRLLLKRAQQSSLPPSSSSSSADKQSFSVSFNFDTNKHFPVISVKLVDQVRSDLASQK